MAAYTVLGATGQTGSSIVEVLLQSLDKKIHAMVRSKKKLCAIRPGLDRNSNVSIFEGELSDTNLLISCITGTHAVFLTAAASDNIPGTTIARHQSNCVVSALSAIRERDAYVKLPQLVVLSSSSLEPSLCKDIPPIGQKVMKAAASYVYYDLREAETFLRKHDWIKQVYIKPGGLVHDRQRGHVLSTERQQTFLSFLDLAAGMVEVADEDGDKWDMKNVSVLPASDGTAVEWWVPWFVTKGLLWHFFPWLYPYLSGCLP